MRIVVNGVMKSGTNALLKAVQMMGLSAEHRHMPWPGDELGDRNLVIVRNPRNVLVSAVRFHGQEVTEKALLAALGSFAEGESFRVHLASYAGWITDARAQVVTYEGLLGRPNVLRGIADYLGADQDDRIFDTLPYLPTATRNDTPSDWRSVWTPRMDEAWQTEGMEAEAIWRSC